MAQDPLHGNPMCCSPMAAGWQVRPIRSEDGPMHRAFFSRLSPETVRLRLFTAMSELSEKEVERIVDVDHLDRFALEAVAEGRSWPLSDTNACPDSHSRTRHAEVATGDPDVSPTSRHDHSSRWCGLLRVVLSARVAVTSVPTCASMKHMSEVGIRALKQNASAVVAEAASGETVTITDRGRPVARNDRHPGIAFACVDRCRSGSKGSPCAFGPACARTRA